jgi:hypothetical protein
MATITLTIPDDKLERVKDGLLAVYPNVSPDKTDNQWLKERIRLFIIQSVKRGESMLAQQAAVDALTETDSLVS